jgi:hypothetical protein
MSSDKKIGVFCVGVKSLSLAVGYFFLFFLGGTRVKDRPAPIFFPPVIPVPAGYHRKGKRKKKPMAFLKTKHLLDKPAFHFSKHPQIAEGREKNKIKCWLINMAFTYPKKIQSRTQSVLVGFFFLFFFFFIMVR